MCNSKYQIFPVPSGLGILDELIGSGARRRATARMAKKLRIGATRAFLR